MNREQGRADERFCQRLSAHALWLHEVGMICSNPNALLAHWRFVNQPKR